MLTICNFMVFPSKSIVRIFYLQKALVKLRLRMATYKVYSNCTDITFCICIILANNETAKSTFCNMAYYDDKATF